VALDSIVRDPTTGIGAAVDASGQVSVALPQNPFGAGFVKPCGVGGQPMLMTTSGHVEVSQDQMVFYDQVDGVVLNSNLWNSSATTMTITQAAGLIGLNAGLSTTTGANARIESIKAVPLYGTMPVVVNFGASVNTAPEANATIEMGIGTCTGTSAPTDGIFFRWTSAATFVGVINFGGAEATTAPMTAPSINDFHTFRIIIDNELVYFAIVDTSSLTILSRPLANPFPVSNARQPVFARVYNGGSAPSTAPRLQIGNVMALQAVMNMNRDWPTTMSSLGRGCYQSPVTTFAQTQNFTNSTAPTNATLANTTAGYTTLGGKFSFAAPAGAATDFALFGFQVPAGFQLFVTRVDINTINTGAAVATTATILDWGIGLNSSSVSLATTDGPGTWAPRRRSMGLQGWIVGAAIGVAAPELTNTYDPPLVVDSGRYFHVIVCVPVGTATASQVVRGSASIHGYFE